MRRERSPRAIGQTRRHAPRLPWPHRASARCPRDAEMCRAMPCDAARCRASARGDATEMPAHAKSFHDLPRAARSRILAFYGKSPRISSVFLSKFRSILPSLPDDETLESRSFREISRVLAFTKFEMCIFFRHPEEKGASIEIFTTTHSKLEVTMVRL